MDISKYKFNCQTIDKSFRFDNSIRYLLHTNDNKIFEISPYLYELLEMIKNKKTIDEIANCINCKYSTNYTNEDMCNLIQKKLIDKNILYNSSKLQGISKANKTIELKRFIIYLNLPFISSIYNFSTIFLFLINKKILVLNILFSIIAFTLYFNNTSLKYYAFYDIAINYLLICIGCLFHEIGHVAACKKYGIKVTGCGIGIYLVFIQIFIKISPEIWLYPKKQRIVVDACGIYFHTVYCAFLSLLSIIFREFKLGYAITVTIWLIFMNINPIFRFDGHWIVSDIMDTGNIVKQAIKNFKRIIKKEIYLSLNKETLLIIFGILFSIMNVMFFMFIIAWLLFDTKNWQFIFDSFKKSIYELYNYGYTIGLIYDLLTSLVKLLFRIIPIAVILSTIVSLISRSSIEKE